MQTGVEPRAVAGACELSLLLQITGESRTLLGAVMVLRM